MSHAWFVVRWLHILAMAFFVGGQLFLAAIIVPVERRAPDQERLRAIARRFGYWTLGALGVLLLTGSAMASHLHLWGDSTFQLKLALVGLIALLIIWHMRRPKLHALEGAIFLCSLAVVWIGLYLANGYLKPGTYVSRAEGHGEGTRRHN